MSEILLTTLFSGYNFGSSLQAYATKSLIEELGYSSSLVARKSLIKGRDFRIGKLIHIVTRTLLTFNMRTLKAYKKSYGKQFIGDAENKFDLFEETFLKPEHLTWKGLQNKAKKSRACIAGSDQIWDPTSLYVDPLYYLRFASQSKRISFATSMGYDYVLDSNKKKIKKWLNEFNAISVREESGVKLIKDLCGRDVEQLLDPTLLINGDDWRKKLGIYPKEENYILAYFLDEPSSSAKKLICRLKEILNCDVVAIPYIHDDMSYADKTVASGPIEFVNLVNNAQVVITDSFHGTAFSVNLHTPFYVFNRNNTSVRSQQTRISSLLDLLNLKERFEPHQEIKDIDVDFSSVDRILNSERKKASDFLKCSINNCH